MDLDPKYTFVPLAKRSFAGYENKSTQELLTKWGIKDNICIQSFSFNEPFQPYLKYHLAESFFKDTIVAQELKIKKFNKWCNEGIIADQVKVEQSPCSVLTMSFFDRLKEPDNNITYDSNKIRKTMRYNEAGEEITDNLKAMLIDSECEEYALYEEGERKEFIFRLIQMLILGGKLCQYEDVLEPYLAVTKLLYKDLIRVDKIEQSDKLFISTIVLEVVAINSVNPYFPKDINNERNFTFLLVDPVSRQITTFIHQLDGYEDWQRLK